MKKIIRVNADGTRDTTLASTYNDQNMSCDDLHDLAMEWTREDDDGTYYYVEDDEEVSR